VKELVSRLTWVDYLAFVAVLRGCYVGYRSGLFPEVLRIIAYVVTVVVTFRFHEEFAQLLTLKTFLNQTTSDALSFFLLIVGVFGLTKLVTLLFLKLLKVGDGNFFYRTTGMILGACRWVILLSLIFMLMDYLPLDTLRKDIRERSVTGPKIAAIAPVLFDFLSTLSPQLAVPKDPRLPAGHA